MTNEKRIRELTKGELADFLRAFHRLCPYSEYADIEAWLESENEEMIWKGEEVRFQGEMATLVDEKTLRGKLYNVLIQKDGTMVNVPRKGW